MKFTINAKELKDVVVKMEKMATRTNDTCYVIAEDHVAKFVMYNIESRMTIEKDIGTYNTGKIAMKFAKIKQLSKLKTDEFTFAYDGNKLIVKADKKTQTVVAEDTDVAFNPLENLQPIIKIIKPKELLEILNNLSLFVSKSQSRFAIYNLNLEEKMFYSLDGHMVIRKDLSKYNIEETEWKELNIPSYVYDKIKNCLKDDNSFITIETNGKFIRFIGYDFRFYAKLYDKEYVNAKSVFDGNYAGEITLDTKQFTDIVKFNKDYGKNGKEQYPMIMYMNTDGKCVAHCQNTDHEESVDYLDATNSTFLKDFVIGLNPVYLLNVMKVVRCDSFVMEFMGSKAPVKVSENGYDMLVLPINIKCADEEIIDTIKKLMEN